jgi:hypothetical protein
MIANTMRSTGNDTGAIIAMLVGGAAKQATEELREMPTDRATILQLAMKKRRGHA